VPFNEYEYILSKIHQTILVFLSIIMQVFPFLMGGALLSACIHEFGSDRFAERFICRSGFLSIPRGDSRSVRRGSPQYSLGTGDPVPEGSRGIVKSVFNLPSVKLCRYIQSMNNEMFSSDPMLYGCAFNVNSGNGAAECDHLLANERPGFDIPEHILEKFSPGMSREDAGIDIASGIIRGLSGTVDGFYVTTPFNREEVSTKLLLTGS
jgi:hypothetical protein